MKQLSIGFALVVGVLLGAAGAVRSQQGTTGTQQASQRIVQFENDDVKVWKSIVVANAPLTMHRHEHGRVIIPLRGGTMKIVEQSGARVGDREGLLAAQERSEHDARRCERRRSADRGDGGGVEERQVARGLEAATLKSISEGAPHCRGRCALYRRR